MNKIIEWFTLKKFLFISLISVFLSFLFFQRTFKHNVCGLGNYDCYDLINFIWLLFVFLGSLFLPIFINFFIKKDQVFKSWRKFTFIYLLVYLFFIILVPWDWGDAYLPIYKGTVALALVVLYSIISLILIVHKSLKKE